MTAPTLYWYRHDLRLSDLPGLVAASRRGPVLPVFILDDTETRERPLGGASRWWLHHSLQSLQSALQDAGGDLILRRGKPEAILRTLLEETGADAIYASRQYQPWSQDLEQDIKQLAEDAGAVFKRFPGTLLYEPEAVTTGSGTPFKVFTPFWRACLRQPIENPPVEQPKLGFPKVWPSSEPLDDWQLLPHSPNWAASWSDLWNPGSNGAHTALKLFLSERVGRYAEGRDVPGETFTSKLSPHLRFGEISPRQIWWAAKTVKRDRPADSEAVDKFLSEIGWREFCHHLVAQFPQMPEQPFNAKFAHFPWGEYPEAVRAWQKGQTGYPIVDAGMRELWQTGFMHNRVRMIVASFLCKHLLSHWREGETWFWDCLLDADIAANSCSWQWVAGSGADAAPYFRIFNPVAQGEKFDKDGRYTRRWVPELADLPDKYLHKPWEAPDLVLTAAGVRLGDNYPQPIVDHKTARETALAAYAHLKAVTAEA